MPEQPTASHSLKTTAIDWCVRLHDDDVSAAEREAFQRWYDADPSHAAEYAKACKIWQVSTELPAPRPQPARRSATRAWARAAVVVLAVAGCWAAGWAGGVLPGSVRYYAAQPTARQLVLPDQSQVDLNRRSTLWYLEYRHQRHVRLSDGEAFFSVFHDASRPFIIRADNGDIRVTGTQFNVWTAPLRTTVTVSQGTVLVSPLSDESSQAAELTLGMQAVFAPGRMLQLNRVNPQQESAWRSGKLVLDDIALRDALPLINRYLDVPLSLGDDGAGELRIGGSYKTAELEQLVLALPQILPVQLHRSADGRLLTSRPARS
ncbi:MAG: FecR family protein [Pseudomonas sp.]